jgi:PKD repeat protein
LPTTTGEVEIEANGESDLVFVDAGDEVTFTTTGLGNATSVLWDFGRDIEGPETRYSNLSTVNHTVHASGRYNVTFTAFYEEENIVKKLILIVNYEEEYQEDIVHNEALFFAIAGSELIMSAMLGYWTHQIRKEKVYL